MFLTLQLLFVRRGVKRFVYLSSSMLCLTPSIHPNRNASSTDSG
jgi:hypothetical protein